MYFDTASSGSSKRKLKSVLERVISYSLWFRRSYLAQMSIAVGFLVAINKVFYVFLLVGADVRAFGTSRLALERSRVWFGVTCACRIAVGSSARIKNDAQNEL